jgi:hypothetical protein
MALRLLKWAACGPLTLAMGSPESIEQQLPSVPGPPLQTKVNDFTGDPPKESHQSEDQSWICRTQFNSDNCFRSTS